MLKYAMSSVKEFKEVYGLYNLDAKLLDMYLTGHEEVLILSFATKERLIEEGVTEGKTFLAAALIHRIVRLYFRTHNTLFYRDVPRRSLDPETSIFIEYASHAANVRDTYIIPPDPKARQN